MIAYCIHVIENIGQIINFKYLTVYRRRRQLMHYRFFSNRLITIKITVILIYSYNDRLVSLPCVRLITFDLFVRYLWIVCAFTIINFFVTLIWVFAQLGNV